jgi:DNA-binding transcriptional ArsR family regulator
MLGYRTEVDGLRAREQALEVQRFGELDTILEQRMGPGRLVSFEDPVPASARMATLRLQLIGRLQFLERLGLATRAGSKTWRLSLDHRPALREMQLLGDVQKSLAKGDLAITDPGALRELVRLEPGMSVRGRVAGTTPNELGEAPFLVLEATDGRVLLIPQTPAMEEQRGQAGLRRGHVVTLREHESARAGRSVRWTEIQEHGRLRDLVRTRELATVLDLEVLERARAGAGPEEPAPARGFARAWARALAGRRLRLAEAGLLVRAGPEGLTIGELGARTGVTGSTLTHHMKILAAAGLVDQKRQGRKIICVGIDFARIEDIATFLMKECCADSAAPHAKHGESHG